MTNNIKKCTNCGYALSKNALSCTNCGTSQNNISTESIPCMLPLAQPPNEQINNSPITKNPTERANYDV